MIEVGLNGVDDHFEREACRRDRQPQALGARSEPSNVTVGTKDPDHTVDASMRFEAFETRAPVVENMSAWV